MIDSFGSSSVIFDVIEEFVYDQNIMTFLESGMYE